MWYNIHKIWRAQVLPRSVSALFGNLPKKQKRGNIVFSSGHGQREGAVRAAESARVAQMYLQVLLLLLRPPPSGGGDERDADEEVLAAALGVVVAGCDDWGAMRQQGYAILLAFLEIMPLESSLAPTPRAVAESVGPARTVSASAAAMACPR